MREEGEIIRWPLSYPIASRWVPFLSPLTRGEDISGTILLPVLCHILAPLLAFDLNQ